MNDLDETDPAVAEAAASERDAVAQCAAMLRERDPDRYLACLFAPEPHRGALFALYAFSGEIARVREMIHEPLPGEVRLQWWRDALMGEARGEVRAHPIAAALLDAIARYRLPVAPLLDLIDARSFDLYDDPMPTLADLEGYCGETVSVLIRLACLVLADGHDPGGAAACGHAGVAYGLTGLMRALPWHARRGQLYLPGDMLQRHGVTREDVVTGRGGPGLVSALAELRGVARHHLARMRDALEGAPPALAPAFLPIALVEPYLRQMERRGYHPLTDIIDRPLWRKQVSLWWASRRGV